MVSSALMTALNLRQGQASALDVPMLTELCLLCSEAGGQPQPGGGG